jgi:hypothetical protein
VEIGTGEALNQYAAELLIGTKSQFSWLTTAEACNRSSSRDHFVDRLHIRLGLDPKSILYLLRDGPFDNDYWYLTLLVP